MSFVTYVPVVEMDAVAPGTMREVDMEGRSIIVANIDGEFFAFQPDCPHSGSNLSTGLLDGKVVLCPNHHYRFDLQTGELQFPVGACDNLTVYTVEPRDGVVCLKIEL